MAAVEPSDPQSPSKGGDPSLSDLQRRDRTLAPYFAYLEDGVLPDEEADARELVLSKSQYTVVDDTLYTGFLLSGGQYRVSYNCAFARR